MESLKKRKLILFNILLTLYVGTNLIGGERGLVSYFEKKNVFNELILKEAKINKDLQDLKHKIKLISNNDLDYLDILYREKLRYGTKDEIIIKLK
jgi:cell division protein FtsB